MTTPFSSRVARSAGARSTHLAETTVNRRQVLTAGAALGALLSLSAARSRASAQTDPPETIAAASDRLQALGLPEITVTVGESGVTAPSEIEEGWHLVSVTAEAPYIAYFDFMQYPDGLDDETALAQALDAGRNDLAQLDWVYAGGTNSFTPGEPALFATYLAPGDYHMAASYYLPEQGSEEIMKLVPLTVTPAGSGTPGAAPAGTPAAASVADVRLEMTDDFRYLVGPDPVPAGDTLWEIVNTGEHHSHHVVMSKYPDGTTAQDIVADFTSLYSGTPPAGEPLVAQAIPIGYAALQSGGITTLIELDLAPGQSYAVVCFIIDPATGRPHFLDGMVTVFDVA